MKRRLNYFTLMLLLLLLLAAPLRGGAVPSTPEVLNAGPDIITGDMGLAEFGTLGQFGSSGTQVGLGMSTVICNAGNVPVDVFAMPDTNHSIIPQNLYRMSGGANNN